MTWSMFTHSWTCKYWLSIYIPPSTAEWGHSDTRPRSLTSDGSRLVKMKVGEFVIVPQQATKMKTFCLAVRSLRAGSFYHKQLRLSIKSLLVTLKSADAQSRALTAADSPQIRQGATSPPESLAAVVHALRAQWKRAALCTVYRVDQQQLLGSSRHSWGTWA